MTSVLDLIRANEDGKVQFIPFAQVARGTTPNPKNFGLFISEVEAEKIGFRVEGGWKKHTYQTQSATIEGYINANPSFIILKQGRMGMFNRATKRFIKYFNKYHNDYNKKEHELRTRYLILFVEGKKPLHNTPIQLTAKGAFGGSLGESLKGFRDNFGKLIGGARQGEFWSKVVFQPELKPKEMKLDATSTWVTSATGYVFPTEENLEGIYLDEELGDGEVLELIKGWLTEYKEFGQFSLADDNPGNEIGEKPKNSEGGLSLLERIRNSVDSKSDEDTSQIPY